MANFNVDTNGNLWIGTNVSDTFSTAQGQSATNFYVTSAGSIYAVDGTIGGIDLATDYIQSSNYSNTSGFEAGFKITDSGDAFFNSVDIRVKPSGGANDDPPTDGRESITIGSAEIYEYNNNLYLNTNSSANKIIVSAGDKFVLSGASANPNLTFDGASTQDIEFNAAYVADSSTSDGRSYSSDPLGQIYELTISNQNVDIYRVNAQNNDVYFYGDVEVDGHIEVNSLKVYDGFGSSGEVLTRTVNGLEWAAAGGSHPDSDHTSFLTSIPSEYLTQTEGDSRYVQSSGHSHSNFVDHVDTSSGGSGGTDALTISNNGIRINFGTTGTRVAVGNHTHSNSGVSSLGDQDNNPQLTGAVQLTTTTSDGYFLSSISGNSGNGTISFNKTSYGYVNTLDPTNSSPKVGISTSDRFSNIYSASFYGTFYGQNINASSRNIKENIVDTALGLDFINDLTVKDFTMIDTDTFGTQKYTGFIAEDIQDYLTDNSLDYKLVEDYSSDYEYRDRCSHVMKCTNEENEIIHGCTDDCCSDYFPREDEDGVTKNYLHETVEDCEAYMPDENRHPHLYFNNFIGPLVKAVQELSTQISDLTARVEALEG